jgi:hypothetical protein
MQYHDSMHVMILTTADSTSTVDLKFNLSITVILLYHHLTHSFFPCGYYLIYFQLHLLIHH